MPRMDGYRLCYEIRKNPALNSTPFVAFTASYTSAHDEQVALDFGADRYLRKPATPEVIMQTIHEAVAVRQAPVKPYRQLDELSAMKEYSEALVQKLEETNSELSQANEALNERVILAEFNGEISNALSRKDTLRRTLQICAEAMVHHLDAAFARIWTYNKNDDVLELQASAGLYTHIDGGHSRVPVGQSEIGLIASEQKPHLTNSVIGDARVHDQDWAKREGMVAFAGYPLLVEDRLVGVMAMFARKMLSQNSLASIESVAKGIAAGIDRKTTEDELKQSDERFRELAENIREIFFIAGPDGTPVHYVSPAFEEITGRSPKGFDDNPGFWLELIHPEDRDRVERAHRSAPERLSSEYRIVRPDHTIRWMSTRSFPVKDDAGKTMRLVGIAEDITDRKVAEQAAQRNLERIQVLHEIDLAITSTLDLRAQLDILLEKIELFVPIAAASTVRLINRENGGVESLASRGIDDELWRAHASTALGGLAESVVKTRAPVSIRDIRTDTRTYTLGIFQKQGLVSYLGIPLLAHEEVLGVLSLYTTEELDFVGEELDFVTTLAGQAAVAIQNAELYERTQKQASELAEQEHIQRILKELGQDITRMDVDTLLEKLTGRIREVFEVDISDVRFLAGEKWSNITVASQNRIKHLPEGRSRGGATDWVIENRKTIAIEDYRERKEFTPGRVTSMFNARGYLAAPLFSRSGEVIGVIRALSKEPRTFTPQEIDLFEQMASGAAIAIENSRL